MFTSLIASNIALLGQAILVFMAAMLIALSAWAKEPLIYNRLFSSVALSSYDTVAYFSENKPAKGDAKFSADYQAAKWHCSSAENRDKFTAVPQNYAPQLGGYCAWAVLSCWHPHYCSLACCAIQMAVPMAAQAAEQRR